MCTWACNTIDFDFFSRQKNQVDFSKICINIVWKFNCKKCYSLFVQKLPDLKEINVLHLEYSLKRYCSVYILAK